MPLIKILTPQTNFSIVCFSPYEWVKNAPCILLSSFTITLQIYLYLRLSAFSYNENKRRMFFSIHDIMCFRNFQK